MPASLYLQNKWLNHVFGNSAFTQPAEWWVQLHYGDPGINCTASTYGPRAGVVDFTVAAAKSNASDINVVWTDLPDPGANADMTWISIWDAETLGNPLTYGELDATVTVAEHADLTILAGDIVQTVT